MVQIRNCHIVMWGGQRRKQLWLEESGPKNDNVCVCGQKQSHLDFWKCYLRDLLAQSSYLKDSTLFNLCNLHAQTNICDYVYKILKVNSLIPYLESIESCFISFSAENRHIASQSVSFIFIGGIFSDQSFLTGPRTHLLLFHELYFNQKKKKSL